MVWTLQVSNETSAELTSYTNVKISHLFSEHQIQGLFSPFLSLWVAKLNHQRWEIPSRGPRPIPKGEFSSFSVSKFYKKAQLSLTNPHDAKACQNCSNPTCLQRCRWQYWPIFMCLTAIASTIRKILRNSLKIQTYGVQGHPRSSILVSIESPYDLLLIINSNFSRICYRSRDIHG